MLLERIRLGVALVMAGIAIVFFGEMGLRPGERPQISAVQAGNFLVGALALWVLRTPSRRTLNLSVALASLVVTVVATGWVGILAQDATTPVVLMVGLTLASATVLPWSPRWQLAGVLAVIATATWTVANIVGSPRLFWLQYVGSLAPTLAGTVVVSYALQRQREALDEAELQRRARETTLREANRRLGQEIEEHRRTEQTLRFAMRELDHRVKNTLATVQSVADQTLRSTGSMREFGEAFYGRIQAMARIHSALAERRWQGLALDELIELVVGPFRHHADSVVIECGGGTFLSSDLARVLGMTLHEMATNAAKYGALSTRAGHLAISSRVEGDTVPRLRIEWSERDGPAIGQPPRRGFGMKLIEEALAYEVGGSVTLSFASQGVHSEIRIPLPAERD